MKPYRIAYCSPVNPAPSGISDYSEELLPYLAQYADVTLFVADGLRPTNPALRRYLTVLPLRRLVAQQRRRPFDAIVYHMGNSPAHSEIWRVAQRLPGVVVLHDFVLHHFMLAYAATALHDVQHYVRTMGEHYGAAGEHIAQLMIRSRFTDAAFDFPCCEPVVAAAQGLIVHSHYVQNHVHALRPDLPVAVVPMGVPLPEPRDQAAARHCLGLPADAVLLASFGHINAYKRIEPVLRALATLRHAGHDVRYLLVGSVSPNYDVRGVVQRMGLADAVTITGYVERDAFEDYVAAADICLNLRHPTGGETSASLLRLLGAGRPTLVSATGAFGELPAGVAAQVDPDANEGDLILAYCRLLIERPDVAQALGAAARDYVAREHTLNRAAQGYMRFLARLYSWDAVWRVRESPLWQIGDREQGTGNREQGTGSKGARARETRRRGDKETGIRGRESTQHSVLSTQYSALVQTVAQSLVELGVTEHDERTLRGVAERVCDLGL